MRERGRRLGLAVLAALLLAAVGWLPATGPVTPAGAVPAPDSIQVTVLSVTPTSPAASARAHKITIRVQLTNTTDATFDKLTLVGIRGNPVSNQSALDAVIGTVQTPDPGQAADIPTKHPVTTSLGPHSSAVLEYISTTSTSFKAGICMCQNRIYPLYFAAHATLAGGVDVVVGTAQTFIPSFGGSRPKPVQVSWVWPLLEQPHRTTSADVFTDDSLAESVSGGRLDHWLQTLELVVEQAPSTPLTLLVDPDLLDELAVMAAGPYRVQTGPGKIAAGTGTGDAASWLVRLRAVLDTDPDIQLAFTPYADPDVRSLTTRGLGWADRLDAQAQRRVAAAIGSHAVDTSLAWPAGSSLDRATLAALVRSGVDTVIVNDRTLPGSTRLSPRPDALAPMPTPAGPATMAITSSTIQYYASAVVSAGGPGVAMLPQLVAELAVRAEEDGANSHYVLITAPRDVDPDPVAASQAVLDTTQAAWAQPLSVQQALEQVTPVRQGALHPQPPTSGLPNATLDAAEYLRTAVPTIASLLTDPRHPADDRGGASDGPTPSPGPDDSPAAEDSAAATELLAGLPVALQRSESAEWAGAPGDSAARAESLRQRVAAVIDGVHLIRPTQGTYTLGSEDSPLPITVDNTLSLTVYVRVRVTTVGGLPGFRAGDVGVLTVAPQSKLPVHVPVHVDRAGRIRVQVELTTPADQSLGPALPLSVRSTAFGQIGKIITFVAGGVLALALLVRLLRRWRRARHPTAPAPPGRPRVRSHV